MKLDYRQRLLATTLLVGASMIATPAFAQDSGQSTVPDQNQATDPGAAPPTGPVEALPTPTVSSTGQAVQEPQEVVVTGSRIPQPNLQSAAPVTVVTNQDVKLSGATRIEDVLAQLPSAAAGQNAGTANGATGTAEIDLRYLGSKRSLTLIDGRRVMPGDPSSGAAADINLIPAALIKRVDVLTGGASSVYGADAVAGVVNFIMDTDFEGLRIDGNWSIFQHNNNNVGLASGQTMRDILDAGNFPYPTGSTTDGRAIDTTIALGAGFDDGRGHVVAYFGYRKINPVIEAQRDYTACALGENSAHTSQNCTGSGTSGTGNAFVFNPTSYTTTTANGGTALTHVFTSTWAPLGNGTIDVGGAHTVYNFNPLNHLQRPDERYTAGAFANYEINSAIKPYLEFMFMDDTSIAQVAPSGDFFTTYTLNCDNPLLSAQQREAICTPYNQIVGVVGGFPVAAGAGYAGGLGFPPNSTINIGGADYPYYNTPLPFFDAAGNQYTNAYFNLGRRNVEGGARTDDLRHTQWRGILGTRGDLSNVFSYDAYYQYGRVEYSDTHTDMSISRLRNALNVVNIDPVTGQRVDVGTPGSVMECRSVLEGTDNNCVPYDIFTGAGPSDAAEKYLNITSLITGHTSEQIAHVDITGDLGQMGWTSPWASDGIGINLGLEHRKETLVYNPDESNRSGDVSGNGGAILAADGNYQVNEVFGEVQIPIVQHTIFDELTFNAGYRRSWYKTSGGGKYNTDTYKLSAEFAPIRDVRLRAAYNRAVRAPNVIELFYPQTVALDGASDPCAGHTIKSDEYGCIAQGLHVGQTTPSNPASQYNGLLGGVSTLQPETATTKTAGVVLQPRFLPRFAATLDYWNIDLKNAVQGFGADAILADCVAKSTSGAPAPSCSLIHRNPGGSLWLSLQGYVEDLPHNVGGMKTDGFDFTTSYSMPLFNTGNLSASFTGTLLHRYRVDNGLTAPYDCVGYYGTTCGLIPKWRHKLRLTWQSDFGLGISGQWRHQSHVTYEGYSTNTTLAGTHYQQGAKFPAYDYFDLAATYSMLNHNLNLRAGINNIFDKSPPLALYSPECPILATNGDTGCNGNVWVGAYDTLGRYIYAGFTLDFLHHAPPAPPPAPLPVVTPPPPEAPATQTCPDGSVILATAACPAPPPPPPPVVPERG